MANLFIEDTGFSFVGTKSDLANELAIRALTELKNESGDEPQTADRIYEKAKSFFVKDSLEDYLGIEAFRQHLSYWAWNDRSPISKMIGQQGYKLQALEPIFAGDEEPQQPITEAEKIEVRQYQKREALLYAPLRNWLLAQGFRVQITANMRDRNLGTWGNPDVTGIKVIENLGSRDIEIATIEAKITDKNFRQDFFEAVSHRRFANRAYFAFAGTKSLMTKSNEELRYFSELYEVGVLLIILDDDTYAKLQASEISTLSLEEVDVYELFSARFEPRQSRWQKLYCQAIGVENEQSLWTWGDSE